MVYPNPMADVSTVIAFPRYRARGTVLQLIFPFKVIGSAR